jgi:hypothetical protein
MALWPSSPQPKAVVAAQQAKNERMIRSRDFISIQYGKPLAAVEKITFRQFAPGGVAVEKNGVLIPLTFTIAYQ